MYILLPLFLRSSFTHKVILVAKTRAPRLNPFCEEKSIVPLVTFVLKSCLWSIMPKKSHNRAVVDWRFAIVSSICLLKNKTQAPY